MRSRLFRRLFLTALQDAFDDGHLRFSGSLQALSDPRGFAAHLQPAQQTEWVVYAKPPFAGPQQVLDYVGRYTHRVAIANQRLIDLDDGHVRFRYTDYRAPKCLLYSAYLANDGSSSPCMSTRHSPFGCLIDPPIGARDRVR